MNKIVPKIRDVASSINERGTRNVEHGTWNVERGTRNTEHGTWNVEHGTRNTEHGTWNVERGTRSLLNLSRFFLFKTNH